MTTLLALGAALSIATAPAAPVPVCAGSVPAADDDLRSLFESGQSWSAFFDAAEARRELWVENWATSESISADAVARAEAAGGTWHILAIAIDGCSDSVNTVPYIARLVQRAHNVDLRIVHPEAGAEVMTAHPTPDGRSATPTFLLLNADFERVGCFVERPDALRDHILANPDGLERMPLYEWKMAWYANDAGSDTVEQMVRTIEAAARGEMICAPATDAIPPQG